MPRFILSVIDAHRAAAAAATELLWGIAWGIAWAEGCLAGD